MNIKEIGQHKTVLNRFDLLGSDEDALSRAFAFILGLPFPRIFVIIVACQGLAPVRTRNKPSNVRLFNERGQIFD